MTALFPKISTIKEITTLLWLVFTMTAVHAQTDAPQVKTYTDLIDEAVENKLVMGIACGIANGQEVTVAHKGYSDENKTTEFDAGTITRIASVVKPMTAIAIMQLVENGSIDLDAPIQTYVADYPKHAEGTMTTRQLLMHTSGTPAYTNNKEANNKTHFASLTEASSVFRDRDLQFTPGSDFGYTSYGYVVLGLIIEQVSGMTYGDYVHKHIFEPSGMEHTTVEDATKEYSGKAELFESNGKGKIRKASPTDLSDRIPGGGIQSTVRDVLQFGRAILEGKLISPESLEILTTDSGMKTSGNPYGMGFYLYGVNPYHGNLVGHTGAQSGCSAQFFIFPERDVVIFVVTNTSNALNIVSPLAMSMFALITQD